MIIFVQWPFKIIAEWVHRVLLIPSSSYLLLINHLKLLGQFGLQSYSMKCGIDSTVVQNSSNAKFYLSKSTSLRTTSPHISHLYKYVHHDSSRFDSYYIINIPIQTWLLTAGIPETPQSTYGERHGRRSSSKHRNEMEENSV